MRRDPQFDRRKQLPLRVLSESEMEHWRRRGYVIVRNAVAADVVDRVRDAMWAFAEMDPADPQTWYGRSDDADHRLAEVRGSGMLEIYHHQAMWDARQSQRVYDAFVDIWDREDLWVNPNRANLLVPNRGETHFDGFVHWDIDTSLEPLPFRVQGVLSLVDTSPEVGGTWAYPGLFEHFDDWVAAQPVDRDPFRPDPASVGQPVFLEMRAGDLLIFNSLLAHGVAPNRSEDKARMAMYIAMAPQQEHDRGLVARRAAAHADRANPKPEVYPGDPRGWERTRYGPAALSPLGRRLLGLESWMGGVENVTT